MDNTFWEYHEDDKAMLGELERTLIPRVETHIGSYTTHGDWYRAQVINGLEDLVTSCTHRHRKETTAQLCAEMMIEKVWAERAAR